MFSKSFYLGLALTGALAGCAASDLTGADGGGGVPVSRHAASSLYLGAEAPQGERFLFSGLGAGRISIAVNSVARRALSAELRCDAPVTLRQDAPGIDDAPVRGAGAGETLAFALAPRERGHTMIEPAAEVVGCDLRVLGGPAPYSLRLEREERVAPVVARLDAGATGCPQRQARDPLEAVFLADHGLSQTCPLAPVDLRLLPDSLEAFQAKVVALTGARMPDAVLESGDITAPIDFSNAPELDMIYVSALQMRADFSGYMIARMLAWHVQRGANVRILLTEMLEPGIDRRFYEGLAARHPGIQLQLFRWNETGAYPTRQFDRLHRTNHVKVFATLARDPQRSVFMIGGRNLHDGFVFDRPRNLSAWPFLRNYSLQRGFSLGFFATYRDIEVAVSGQAAVRAMAAHMAGYWHRDHDTQAMLPAHDTGTGGSAGGTVRHFLSLPFVDDHALEDHYIALFDAARHRIDLASPFLNLPPRLEAALDRALARGVEVRLLTRTEIPEPATLFVVTQNRMFARRYADRIAIFAHDPSLGTLHSKIVVIDRRLVVVTSTNLNRRSFWHDTENGLTILDPVVAERFIALIDRYQRDSGRQGPEQQISPLLEWFMQRDFVKSVF